VNLLKLKDIKRGFFKNPVVTIGMFDGVHRGHKSLLEILKEKAIEYDGTPLVITLWPHPRMVLYPERQIKILSTLEEKLSLLEQNGINNVVIIDFDSDFAKTSANEFIDEYLVNKINLKCMVVGFDNHFGFNKEGKYDFVKTESTRYNFDVAHVDPEFEGRDAISSTNIRLYLELGDIKLANLLLGYNYIVTGKVIEGDKIGRKIGFPTANIETPEYKMIPRVGVYAVSTEIDGKVYDGMLNIGFRPTLNHITLKKNIEVHLLNFNDNLYNKTIKINFVERIRDEIKFSGLDALKEQLIKDKQTIQNILQSHK